MVLILIGFSMSEVVVLKTVVVGVKVIATVISEPSGVWRHERVYVQLSNRMEIIVVLQKDRLLNYVLLAPISAIYCIK